MFGIDEIFVFQVKKQEAEDASISVSSLPAKPKMVTVPERRSERISKRSLGNSPVSSTKKRRLLGVKTEPNTDA